MTGPATTRERNAPARESTAMVLGSAAQLPDLSKSENLVKFAALFSGDQLSKLNAEQQAIFLTTLGNHLGVRAELGEIMLYQGKPYLTIDGRIRIAHNSGLLNGIDPQPASSMERSRYGVKDGEQLWKCLVWKKGALRPFTGWGHVRTTDRNPVSKQFPQEMAKKRAKYDALRLAFPPNEEITPLHEHYIQEAEDEAKTHPVAALRAGNGVYDVEPDDDTVLTDEIAIGGNVAAVPAPAADTTPALEDDVLTLEQAKATRLAGPPGSWSGKAGELLDTFSSRHLESIRTWCAEKLEEREDPAKQLMVDAITLILGDRAKSQTTLDLDAGKTAEAVASREAEKKDDGGSLPF